MTDFNKQVRPVGFGEDISPAVLENHRADGAAKRKAAEPRAIVNVAVALANAGIPMQAASLVALYISKLEARIAELEAR